MTNRKAWIGVDLDGTLAKYDGWQGINHIGEPILPMVDKVKTVIEYGHEVKIFTARVCDKELKDEIISIIHSWCLEHLGFILDVTNEKDFGMVELWDDRCRRVISNTGEFCCDNV